MSRCVAATYNWIHGLHSQSTLGCFAITTVFSHAHTVVLCGSCSSILCQPTGGKARLTEGEHPSFSFTRSSLITCMQVVPSVERTSVLHQVIYPHHYQGSSLAAFQCLTCNFTLRMTHNSGARHLFWIYIYTWNRSLLKAIVFRHLCSIYNTVLHMEWCIYSFEPAFSSGPRMFARTTLLWRYCHITSIHLKRIATPRHTKITCPALYDTSTRASLESICITVLLYSNEWDDDSRQSPQSKTLLGSEEIGYCNGVWHQDSLVKIDRMV